MQIPREGKTLLAVSRKGGGCTVWQLTHWAKTKEICHIWLCLIIWTSDYPSAETAASKSLLLLRFSPAFCSCLCLLHPLLVFRDNKDFIKKKKKALWLAWKLCYFFEIQIKIICTAISWISHLDLILSRRTRLFCVSQLNECSNFKEQHKCSDNKSDWTVMNVMIHILLLPLSRLSYTCFTGLYHL